LPGPFPLAEAKLMLHDLRRLARPLMWVITLVPFGVGYLMAHRQQGAHQSLCRQTSSECVSAILSLSASLLVWGPLICLAALAINDVYDVQGDSLNPRRVDAPVSTGRRSTRFAFVAAHVAAAGAVLVAANIRPAFALVTLVFLVLAWLYSIPPVRLKVRPGFDVAINAVGDGGLTILGGWTSARSIGGFPWVIFVVGCLAAAGWYLPTTILDYESDLDAGYTTTAIRLGPRVTYRIGLGFWTAAGVACFALAATGVILPRHAMWPLAVSVPGLIWLYYWALGRAYEQPALQRGMTVMSYASFGPLLVILLMYAGIL